jgi:precorrin-3B methylase
MRPKPVTRDVIRKELRRQSERSKLKVRSHALDKPDTLIVSGTIDLYALAKAVLDQ